MSDTAQWSHL